MSSSIKFDHSSYLMDISGTLTLTSKVGLIYDREADLKMPLKRAFLLFDDVENLSFQPSNLIL